MRGNVPQSHTSTQQWQSFELRMRQRRVQRCVQRANEALAAGRVAHAQDALEEARHLDPGSAEVTALAGRVEAVRLRRAKRTAMWRPAAAAMVLAAAGLSWIWIGSPGIPYQVLDAVMARHTPPQLTVDPLPATAQGGSDEAALPVPVGSEVLLYGEEPALSDDSDPAPDLAAFSDAASDPAAPIPDPEPPPPAPPAQAPEAPAAAPIQPPAQNTAAARGAAGTTGVPPAEAATAPARDDPAITSRAAAETPVVPPQASRTAPTILTPQPSAPEPIAPPAPEVIASRSIPDLPPAAVDLASSAPVRPDPLPASPAAAARESAPAGLADERLVRAALNRYQAAYSDLDAAAAGAVWPSVDRRALARAFDGLADQSVSLGQCDVRVNGAAATAECRGQARWTPKVGGGAQSAARQWRFELSQAGEQWIITQATVR
jgi:hypothetical protein